MHALQVMLSFANKAHQNGVEYSITATASNEFGASKPSGAFVYKTPRRAFRPIIESVELPSDNHETFDPLLVTVAQTGDGGSRELGLGCGAALHWCAASAMHSIPPARPTTAERRALRSCVTCSHHELHAHWLGLR